MWRRLVAGRKHRFPPAAASPDEGSGDRREPMKCLFSETAAQVDAYLYGASHLGEAAAHGLEPEGLIAGIQRIVHPQSYLSVAFVQADAAVQGAVQGLTGVVFFSPVDASGSFVVGIQGDVVQPGTFLQTDDVLGTDVERVFGNEGYVAAVVVHFVAHDVVGKCSVSVAVTAVQRQVVGQLGAQGCFGSQAPAFPAFTVMRPSPLAAKREICWSRVSM